MSCLGNNDLQLKNKIASGIPLVVSDKMKYISSLAKDDLNTFFEMIQHFENRMSVFKDESSGVPVYHVGEVTNSKAENDINVIDSLERLFEIEKNKAFHTEEDKHKIATTLTVNAIIESIPLINEVPRATNLARQKYTYTQNLPVTKTRQLLYNIYTSNGIVPSTDSLKETIIDKLESNTLEEDEKRILVSIYNYVFSDSALEYKGPTGKVTTLRSLSTIAKESQSFEIRERARNYTRMFHTAIVAVNNFSALMIVSEEGNTSLTQDDTMLFRMTSVNAPQINNLFDTLDIVDVIDDKNSLVDVQIKESVVKSFITNNIGVYGEIDTKTGKEVSYAIFDYKNDKGETTRVRIPFTVTNNKASIIDVNQVYASQVEMYRNEFLAKGESEETALQKAEIKTKSILMNPDVIQFILNEIGYKGVVNRSTINNILKSRHADKSLNDFKVKQNVDNLWRLITSGIVSISANIEIEKLQGKRNFNHDFFNTGSRLVSKILKTIREAFKYIAFDKNPNNNNKAFQASSLVEEGLDIKEFNSSIISPTGFWKNNQWLAKEIMSASGIYRKASQYNGDGENVDKNNIASRAELINKYISDIQQHIAGGGESAFKTNPFVNGRAKIDKVIRLDSFKNTKDAKGKSHMDMTSPEIHGVATTAFVNELLESYDHENKISPSVLVTPQTYSDKVFWGGFITRFLDGHDFFPIKDNKLDIRSLLQKEFRNQQAQDRDFTLNFINEWNKMYTVDPITGAKIDVLGIKIDPNVIYGDKQSFEKYLKELKIDVTKDSPISAIQFKYYNSAVLSGLDGNPDFTRLTVAPALIEKLLRVYNTEIDYKATTLANLAVDHSLVGKHGHSLHSKSANNKAINKRLQTSFGKDFYLGEDFQLDMSSMLQLDANGVPQLNKIGTFVFNPSLNDNTIEKFIQQLENIHPVNLSMFFAHNYTNTHLNEMLLGSMYQFKNKSEDSMLGDLLKRSVGAASPGVPLSVDPNNFPEKEDLRLPLYSNTLSINESEAIAAILGTGKVESVEPMDGSSVTNPLTEALIQASLGGVQGLMPNSSLKLFYANVDKTNKDYNLLKYALHVITEEMLNLGTPQMWTLMKLQLGTINLGRPITLPAVIVDGETIVPARVFGANETLFNILIHVKSEKDKVKPSFDSFKILIDLVRENPDIKNRFVHQLILPSANKTGQAMYHNQDNILARLAKGETLGEHEFRKIDNRDLTMQLDATHDPENGTYSKFSQAITNAIQEGRTYEIADQLLNKLAQLVDVNLSQVREMFSNGIYNFENGDFDIKSFRLDDVKEFRDFKGRPDKDYIEHFNKNLTPERRTELFIRSTVMDSMEQQNKDNSTYKELGSDNFSMQSPQVAALIESGVRAYINRKTVALKFSGGNYILAPTHGLFEAYTLKRGKETLRVVGKATMERRINEKVGWSVVEDTPDLKWKLATNKKTGGSIYDTTEWEAFAVFSEEKARIEKVQGLNLPKPERLKLKEKWLNLRHALQKQLDTKDEEGNLVWEIQPAEVIMPFAFKKEFGLLKGMQPSDVTVEFFERQLSTKSFLNQLAREWVELDQVGHDNLAEELSKATGSTVSVFQVHKLLKLNREGAEVAAIAEVLGVEEDMVIDVINGYQMHLHKSRKGYLKESVRDLAEAKFKGFQKVLDVVVGRIPSTGMQSMVAAKVVAFVESNKNSIWFPKELMMIQGADLDIDKAVVMSWWFDENGLLIDDDSPKGLQNQITQLQYDGAIHPSNQIVSDSPVDMAEAKEERDRRKAKDPNPFVARAQSLMSVYISKVLASEGKSMVGIVMNLYKAYNLIYYTDLKTQRNGKFSQESKVTVSPFKFFNGTTLIEKEGIANLDPEVAATQAWSFFSTLGNAATDNAKEMILGAIKANPQTGNIIGLMTIYGVEVEEIFDYLSQPIVQEVMQKVRNSGNVMNDWKIPLSINTCVALVLKDHKVKKDAFLKGNFAPLTQSEGLMLHSLLAISESANELQVLAGALGINRELPVSPYDRYAYKQKLTNYVNEQFFKKELDIKFDFQKFATDSSYANDMIAQYSLIQKSFNVLKVINDTPDIKKYIESMFYLDSVLENMSDKYVTTERVIGRFKQQEGVSYFANIKEEEYKGAVRFLEEFTMAKYVQESGIFDDFNIYQEGQKIPLNIKSLSDIAKYQQMFPEFLVELQTDNKNPLFSNNKFFSSLQPMINAKGKYIIVPNIQDMSATEQFELQAALNNFKQDVKYKGMTIPNSEFKRMLFLYACVNSKGKVSTTSFFELFNPEYKSTFEYTEFLKANENIASQIMLTDVTKIDNLASALKSVLPTGDFADSSYEDEFGNSTKVEKVTYRAVLKEDGINPPFVSGYLKGIPYTYKLTSLKISEGVYDTLYSIIKPIYRSVSLSVSSDLKELTHITMSHIFKTINDPKTVTKIALMKGDDKVNVVIKTKNSVDRDVDAYTQFGEFLYNPKKEELKSKCN